MARDRYDRLNGWRVYFDSKLVGVERSPGLAYRFPQAHACRVIDIYGCLLFSDKDFELLSFFLSFFSPLSCIR